MIGPDLVADRLPAPQLGVELRREPLRRRARGDARTGSLKGASRLVCSSASRSARWSRRTTGVGSVPGANNPRQ
jgi:hypothetical protein